MSNYTTIITNHGKAQITAAIASNTRLNITHLAVGDGNGSTPTPSANQSRLVAEKHRLPVNSVERHRTNDNWIEVGVVIPSSSGGYTMREIGLYAGSTLIAVGSFPATYKPTQDEGGAREMSIRIILAVENASVVNVAMDSSLVYVTKKWVDDNFVGYAEVVDNLTSTDVDKPLSANMGKKLGDDKADKSVEIIAGNGLTGGGSLSSDANIALGTPSKITAASTNTVSANTHSHEIDKASGSVAGIVQLSHKTNGTDKTLAVSEYALGQAVNALQAQAESRVVTWDNLSNKPSQFAPTSHKHRMDEILGLVNALNKKLDVGRSAPSAYKLARAVRINGIEFDGTQNITITDNTKAPLSHRHTWNEIDGKPAVITNPTQITRGDLDNYKEIGFYYCEADAYARDIANTPSNRAFALEVVRAAGVVQIFREYETAIVYMRAFYRRWSPWKRLATTEDNAPTTRTLAITGDGTGQANFDGSANANIALTLANSGVTAGSYNSV
ncbi:MULTISPECIES: phage tail protein, partial [unclassified Moraxella]|uniref:phage tail-collar fiber domain-containing protein n=1 Tax=unclassified Moraxella TaxID=2685852 RepID=UPI00359D0DE9